MTTINVTESTTTVTTTNDVTTINISNTGLQGATGATGASGVIAVTSPITNSGSASSATIGINQSLLSITKSQVSDFTSGTVTSANTALTAGTASYATTSGTALTISGTITYSQVSDFASGTVANISGTVTQSQVSGLGTALAGKFTLSANNTATGQQIFNADSDASIPLQVRIFSPSQSANIQEWDTSTGTALASIDSQGRGNFPRVTAGSATDLGYGILSVNTGGTANKGLTVRGAASQSANLLEIQDSSAGTLTLINSAGRGAFPRISAGAASDLQYGTLSVLANNTATVPIVARGVSGQSANLQEWQSSTGSTAAYVTGAGVGRFEQVQNNSGYVTLGYNQSGGHVTMTRATAIMTAPSANTARLYFRTGTTGLKLVAMGTAGTEYTILDNIV